MSEEQRKGDLPTSLGQVPLEPGTFEHDVAVSDRYQLFSAELLRLSLLGIGAVGFLTEHLKCEDWSTIVKQCVTLSLLFLSLSAAAALAHRYVGPDSLAFHLEYVRLRRRGLALDQSAAKKERRERNWLFKHAGSLLLSSASSLGLGSISLAAGFVFHLWRL